MKKLLGILLALPLTAPAATLELVNHTGAQVRVVDLFNVCQGYLVPEGQPIFLQDGESRTFTVPLVMHHYKICGSGFCSATAIQMKEGETFKLDIVLSPAGVINGVPMPDQWGGPTNPCPAQ